MSNKPIFVATHPRACSTAFERVFMARQDVLTCVHEPFGDAFYFGPERLGERYENDPEAREASGFSESTFKTVLDRIEKEGKEGKRLFIKDITHYLLPPNGQTARIAPSLEGQRVKQGVGTNGATNGTSTPEVNGTSPEVNGTSPEVNGTKENGTKDNITNGHTNSHTQPPFPYPSTSPEANNPTVIPASILSTFHFTFLIRHPRSSIPSYYRCTIPPLAAITGFSSFMPSEAGYDELRRFFDFLRASNQIGTPEVKITLIDADDLLDNPEGILRVYCKDVGLEFSKEMLEWSEGDRERAREAFEKWRGFHEDAIESSCLRGRETKKKAKTEEAENAEWKEKYGEEGQKVIRACVEANLADYEYLKSFAIKV